MMTAYVYYRLRDGFPVRRAYDGVQSITFDTIDQERRLIIESHNDEFDTIVRFLLDRVEKIEVRGVVT